MDEKQQPSWFTTFLTKFGLAMSTTSASAGQLPIAKLSGEEKAAYEDIRRSLESVFAETSSDSTPPKVASSAAPEVVPFSATPITSAAPAMRGAEPMSSPGQLLNLPDPKGIARYTITGRVWPTTVGEASICMWKDDKLAAFSLTIDDNHQQDHAFWTQLSNEFGFKLTWFLIVNKIGWQTESWATWQALLNAGHDIQSHGFSHLCDAMFNCQREYKQAVDVLSKGLNGAQVVTHAYAFGFKTNKVASPCECIKSVNERAEAAKNFLAARDVIGSISAINKIDFLAVPSISNLRNFFNKATPFANFETVFDPTNKVNYRAWYCGHMHNLHDQPTKDSMRQIFQYLKTKSADVWVGTFTQVAKYAQEFATAKIIGLTVQGKQIRFEVKDQMYNAWFNFPLTIKIRLDASWGKAVKAVQNGKALKATLISNAGVPYALVDVVPDAGVVVLTPA